MEIDLATAQKSGMTSAIVFPLRFISTKNYKKWHEVQGGIGLIKSYISFLGFTYSKLDIFQSSSTQLIQSHVDKAIVSYVTE